MYLNVPVSKTKSQSFILKLSSGPVAKFSFSEQLTIKLPFEKMESSFFEIVSSFLISIFYREFLKLAAASLRVNLAT